MIKFSVIYPFSTEIRFDFDYYMTKHVPMAAEQLGADRTEVDKGLSGAAPGSSPPFFAMAHFYFSSIEAFQGAMATAGGSLAADVPNYTDVVPVIQLSEILAV